MSRIQDILDSENRINKTEFQSLRAIMEKKKENLDANNFSAMQEALFQSNFDEYQKDIDEHKEYLSSIDPVNHPPHYTTGQFEVINILEDKLSKEEFKGFLKGNILKYVFRADHKGGKTDYEKARFYLNRLIGDENNV